MKEFILDIYFVGKLILDTQEIHSKNIFDVIKMDYVKKQQCFVTLRRLMINSNGKDFQNTMDSNASTNDDSKGIFNVLILSQLIIIFYLNINDF